MPRQRIDAIGGVKDLRDFDSVCSTVSYNQSQTEACRLDSPTFRF